MIVLCDVLSGIEDWVGMEAFAEEKEAWLRAFLKAFLRWVQAALPSLSGEHICFDGKTLRGSRVGDQAVHLLSA